MTLLLQLQQFAFAHPSYRIGRDLEVVELSVVHGHQQAARKQVVANEDGDLVLPDGIDRCHTTAFFGLVDHIVVDQCGGVQQLYHGCTDEGPFRDRSTEAGRQEDQRWPNALTALLHDVADDGVEQCRARAHLLTHKRLESTQFVFNRRRDFNKGSFRSHGGVGTSYLVTLCIGKAGQDGADLVENVERDGNH